MGIRGLAKFIGDQAPDSIYQTDIKSYFGKRIAVDAYVTLYQFLIAIQKDDGGRFVAADGETTSHLLGIFYRVIRLAENGIEPVFVFDGKPPEMKWTELQRRYTRREEVRKILKRVESRTNSTRHRRILIKRSLRTRSRNITTDANKLRKQLVTVNNKHIRECKTLLKLMGIPYIKAPCEAEAQCAAMVKAGVVYATVTEDLDALTFGSPVLVRHMKARKTPLQEISYEKVLTGLNLTSDEFVDLCILFGCDYCGTIKGIGPKKAFKLITKHRNIPEILEKIDKKKHPVPENWNYEKAKELFVAPAVLDPNKIVLRWRTPDEEGLVQFLCGYRQFNEFRVRRGARKLAKAQTKIAFKQYRRMG